MKYVLLVATILIVGGGVLVLSAQDQSDLRTPSTVGEISATGQDQVGAPIEPATAVAVESTATPLAPTISRATAVRWGEIQAKGYGESAPVLVDASLGPISEQRAKVRGVDTPAHLVGSTQEVWLVQMKGIFKPPRQPRWSNLRPEPGILYIFIDAKTGQKLGSGYRPLP